VRLAFEENTFKIARLVLAGQDTLLDLGGTIDAGNRRVSVDANGTANLAILQGFYPELSAFGAATLNARLQGPFGGTSLTGTANIKGGRLRHSALPHGLNDINGPIRVDTGRITVDGVTAQLGEGPIVFGGAIALNGYVPEEYNLTARGRSMRLRYPEGLVSTVDATLYLEGAVSTPVLRGLVEVLSAQVPPPG
jgi:autotransporter translocation and assembly factor TamB